MKTINQKLNEARLLSYPQLLSVYNLSRFDFRTKDEILKYLVREWQKKNNHIFITERA